MSAITTRSNLINITGGNAIVALGLVFLSACSPTAGKLGEGIPVVDNCPKGISMVFRFCTDEHGGCSAGLDALRADAVQTGLVKADVNRDGKVFFGVNTGASRIAPTEYNQRLSEAREEFVETTVGYAAGAASMIAEHVGGAARGELDATGGENANNPEDRYAQLLITDDPTRLIKLDNGMVAILPGFEFRDVNVPACTDPAPRAPGG